MSFSKVMWISFLTVFVVLQDYAVHANTFISNLYYGYPYQFAISRAAQLNDLNALDQLSLGSEWNPAIQYKLSFVKLLSPDAQEKIKQIFESYTAVPKTSEELSQKKPVFPQNYEQVYLDLWAAKDSITDIIRICNAYSSVCRYMALQRQFPLFTVKGLNAIDQPDPVGVVSSRMLTPVYMQQVELVSRLLEFEDENLRQLLVWSLLMCRGKYDSVSAHVIAFGFGLFEARVQQESWPVDDKVLKKLVQLFADGFKQLAQHQSNQGKFLDEVTRQALDMAGGAELNEIFQEHLYSKSSGRADFVSSLVDNGLTTGDDRFQPWGYLAVLAKAHYFKFGGENVFKVIGRVSMFFQLEDVNMCLKKPVPVISKVPSRSGPLTVAQFLDGKSVYNPVYKVIFAGSFGINTDLVQGMRGLLLEVQNSNFALQKQVLLPRMVNEMLRFVLSMSSTLPGADRFADMVLQQVNTYPEVDLLKDEFMRQHMYIQQCRNDQDRHRDYQNRLADLGRDSLKLNELQNQVDQLQSKLLPIDDIVLLEIARSKKEGGAVDFVKLQKLFRQGYQLIDPMPLLETCLQNRWYRLFALLRKHSDLSAKQEAILSSYKAHHPWYMKLDKKSSWRRSIALALQRLKFWNSSSSN
ncbi:hypothetical protein MP228_003086 [Amoeboaphelidium protococcarum]|nr:hypothetical protein MP228_003086 [Amoeboaphelidium protococcarum]